MHRGVAKRLKRTPQDDLEAAVELDHVQMGDVRRQPLGQHAGAAADLEHDVARVQRGQALDDVEDVAIDEEVLPELALAGTRPRPAHHPNTSAALRCTAAASSS